MSRRNSKQGLLDLLEPLIAIIVIILILLWFSNRQIFWLWFVVLICILGILIGLVIVKQRARIHKNSQWRTDSDLIYWLRGLKPWEFEDYVAELFKKMGYVTERVGQTNDHGVDVVIKKDGQTSYIQCKKFITQPVSVGQMRDFYGAIVDHLANGKAYFVTTNVFTYEAEKFAEDKPIELIDRFKLVKYIRMSENSNK